MDSVRHKRLPTKFQNLSSTRDVFSGQRQWFVRLCSRSLWVGCWAPRRRVLLAKFLTSNANIAKIKSFVENTSGRSSGKGLTFSGTLLLTLMPCAQIDPITTRRLVEVSKPRDRILPCVVTYRQCILYLGGPGSRGMEAVLHHFSFGVLHRRGNCDHKEVQRNRHGEDQRSRAVQEMSQQVGDTTTSRLLRRRE